MGADASPEPSLPPGGRKLALLAYLALAGRPLTRDHLGEVFWGDREEARARHSLREALSHLRRVLGADSIPAGGESVALAPAGGLDVDLLELGAAAKAGDHARVLTLAQGTFLDGVHVPGSIRFEEWLGRERAAADRWVESACAAGCAQDDLAAAGVPPTEAAARWLEISPMEPAAQLALLRTHAAPATREAIGRALAEYRRLTERLAREYDAAPAPQVEAAATLLAQRWATAPSAMPATVSSAGAWPAVATTPSPAPRGLLQRIRRGAAPLRGAISLSVVAVAAGTGIVGWRLLTPAHATVPSGAALVAITGVRSISHDTADAWLEAGVPEMLGMGLARAGMDVVPPGRIREAEERASSGGRLPVRAAAALAGDLGATWQVDGGITHGPQGFVLDLEVRSAPGGASRASITVTGPDLVTAVDRATTRLVAALDAPAAGLRLENVETGSMTAYRAFTAGLQARYEGRTDDAVHAFDAAIAADSGFVSAVVERMLVGGSAGHPRVHSLYARLHDRAPEFDRRVLQVVDAFYNGDGQRAEQLARQLAARYPHDPRAYDYLHMVLSAHGRFAEARQAMIRRLQLDSLATASTRAGPCALCTSHAILAVDYGDEGRALDAERAARRAVELQPENPWSWAVLSHELAARRCYDEAIRVESRAVELDPGAAEYAVDIVRRQIEAGYYGAAESTIRRWRRAGTGDYVSAAADLEATLLREQGRLAEAAAVLTAYLQRDTAEAALPLVLGHTLGDAGQAQAAEHAFVAHAHMEPRPGDDLPAATARAFAWPHALLADALYLAGSTDTTRLSALADSIQQVGARSYFARDWIVYHHVRGLVHMIAHRWPQAEQEFRAARYGAVGWSRTLAEEARAQLAQGKADSAVATLRVAYRAPLDGMGRYLPRSELNLLMAHAFAAAGQPDSAALYRARVQAAWAHADPEVKARLGEWGRPAERAGRSRR